MKETLALIVFVLLSSIQIVVGQCSRVGNFVSNGSDTPTRGTATHLVNSNGMKQVQLGSNFSTSKNGPDLHVILCKTAFYTPATDLIISGVLTKTSGAQTFSVPSQVDLSDFQYVLIHCVQYNHRFGYALLGNQSGASCLTLSTTNYEPETDAISVFPNPTKGQLTFSVQEEAKVSVYNNIGRLISSNFFITKEKNSLSLDYLPAGTYLMELITSNKRDIKKIIKI